jgi:predicted DCC family thiol-disulfide oxidoreductase YuxK
MEPRHIIVFDGVCNLCNRLVNFIIRRDPAGRFAFAPMQGETGRALLARHGIGAEQVDTFLLIRQGVALQKSDAALEIARQLRGVSRLLLVLRVLPRRWRDWLYSLVARNRYRWFGRRRECAVPDPASADRFL